MLQTKPLHSVCSSQSAVTIFSYYHWSQVSQDGPRSGYGICWRIIYYKGTRPVTQSELIHAICISFKWGINVSCISCRPSICFRCDQVGLISHSLRRGCTSGALSCQDSRLRNNGRYKNRWPELCDNHLWAHTLEPPDAWYISKCSQLPHPSVNAKNAPKCSRWTHVGETPHPLRHSTLTRLPRRYIANCYLMMSIGQYLFKILLSGSHPVYE